MTTINEETLSSVITKRSLVLLAALTIAAFGFFSVDVALGILAGGVIAIANFLWMGNTLQRILGFLPDNPVRYSLFRFLARMTVLGLVLYLALTSGWFSTIGLVIGLSIIVANIIALSFFCAHRAGG
jgi:hypothetical protein